MTGQTKWKLLIVTADESEAVLMKARLEGEGIRCHFKVKKEFAGASHGGKSGEVEVYVPLEEFEASQQIVESGEIEEENGF